MLIPSQTRPAASETIDDCLHRAGGRCLLQQAERSRTAAYRQRAAFAGLAAIALIPLGCSGGAQAPTVSSASNSHLSGPQVRPKFVVKAPVNPGVYLGVQVNPSAFPNSDPQDLETATEALEAQVYGNNPPQHFAWHLQYRDWYRLIQAQQSNTQDIGLADDVSHGRVPVISLNCGDDNPSNPQPSLDDIIAGNADADQS